MKRLFPALLAVSGFLLAFVPHFVLPLGYYRTVTMAFSKPEARFWTHPEFFLGVAVMALGLNALFLVGARYRAAMAWGALAGLGAVLQGVYPVSFSWWMGFLPDYERAYHAKVLVLHAGYGPAVAAIGLAVLAASAAGFAHSCRRPGPRRRLTLLFVAGGSLFRKPFRTLGLLTVPLIASAIMFSGTYVLLTTIGSGRLAASRLGADVIVVPEGYEVSTKKVFLGGEPAEFVLPEGTFGKVSGLAGVGAAAPQLYIRALPYRGCCAVLDTLVVGIDPGLDFTVRPWMEYSISDKLGPGEVVVGRHVMFAPGQRMQFFDELLLVTGTLGGTGMEYFDTSSFISLDQAYVFASRFPEPEAGAAHIPRGAVSSVLVRAAEGFDAPDVAARIRDAVPGVSVIEVESLISPARVMLAGTVDRLAPVLALVWALCFLIQLAVFLMMSNERMREVGLIRAMGARKSHVVRLFLYEAGFIAGLGSIAGAAAGWMLALAYRHWLSAYALGHYRWPGLSQMGLLALSCVVLGLAVGVGSALSPAYRLAAAEPYDAIRRGE